MDSVFLKKYGLVEWDDYMMLNEERGSVNQKIEYEVITECELALHLKVELTLHKLCKHKIQVELEKNHVVIDTQVLAFLYAQVFVMFQNLHKLFSVGVDLLTSFLNFSQDNVPKVLPNFEIDTVRNVYKEVTRLCGTNNVGVWIDYMRFEQEYGDKNFMREICRRVKIILPCGLFSTFMEILIKTALSKEDFVVVNEVYKLYRSIYNNI